jgi:hypothetical protein
MIAYKRINAPMKEKTAYKTLPSFDPEYSQMAAIIAKPVLVTQKCQTNHIVLVKNFSESEEQQQLQYNGFPLFFKSSTVFTGPPKFKIIIEANV